VNDVQGCDFVTATELICASDDSSETLFSNAKPLLEVQLSAALSGGDVTGHVATGVLRVEIIQPGVCEVATTVYGYQPS
jgi:hypothetical protein